MPPEIGDLINFSHSPPSSPGIPQSTPPPQASTSPSGDRHPTILPSQVSMWSTNNWAPITAQPRVNQAQAQAVTSPRAIQQDQVQSPGVNVDHVEIAEGGFVDKGKGKEGSPSTTTTHTRASRTSSAASDSDKNLPRTSPSASFQRKMIINHVTPSMESRKNIPLPASPYGSTFKAGSENGKSPSINSGKNIPLPASPLTDQFNVHSPSAGSGRNKPLPSSTNLKADSDAQSSYSFNSDETTQSRLSATAQPFTTTSSPQNRIKVVRNSDPPTFFPSRDTSTTSWEQDQAVQSPIRSESDVSADQMDPAYYNPGYGGRPTLISTASRPKSPTWFARPQSRVVSITSPIDTLDKSSNLMQKEEAGSQPSTPITSISKIYDGSADSPISNRVMREENPISPSEVSSDDDIGPCKTEDLSFADRESTSPSELYFGQVDVDAGHISEPIERITAHLSSISLSTSEQSVTNVPPHPSSDATVVKVEGQPNPYSRARSGRLTPEIDDKDDVRSIKGVGPMSENRVASSEEDAGFDTTLVSEGLFDFTNSLDELDEIENAWLQFRDGYGVFSGSIDEALARLKREMTCAENRLIAAQMDSAHVSQSSDVRLDNARSLALQSSLRNAKSKLGNQKEAIESLKKEKQELERSNNMLAAAANTSAIQLRAAKDEVADLKAREEKLNARNTALYVKYSDLEETYEVLKQRFKPGQEENFAIVLLEGEGRMFDEKLLGQGSEGGRLMASKLVNKLANLCGTVLDFDAIPKIVIQMFLDVDETVRDLQKTHRIGDEETFLEVLSGFQAEGLVSVNITKGLNGPGQAISKFAKFYATIPQCQMITLGAGWKNPYLGLIETQDRNLKNKLYALRSTNTIEKDPFLSFGRHKLLYIKHIFPTGVEEWKSLLKGSGVHRSTPDNHYASSSVATSRASTPPPPLRLVSPDSSPTSRVPVGPAPWTIQAPRGGSLLDQMHDQMRQAQSTRTSSPGSGSDDTVGPSRSQQGIVIPIDPGEGSVGGSPPSSDSDRPSVAVPHSARKHVRRPIPFNNNEHDDDTASEYSSVSAVSTIPSVVSYTSPATRSNFHPQRENPLLRMRRPGRSSLPPASPAANPNNVPLGNRVASGSSRIPWSERGPSDASSGRTEPAGFRWQDSQRNDAGPSTQGIKIRGAAKP